jgi:hypothetical protein
MCPAMDSSLWYTKNLGVFWSQTAPALLIRQVKCGHFHLKFISFPNTIAHECKWTYKTETMALENYEGGDKEGF